MAELADAQDLGSCPARGPGSTPGVRITRQRASPPGGPLHEQNSSRVENAILLLHHGWPLKQWNIPPFDCQLASSLRQAAVRPAGAVDTRADTLEGAIATAYRNIRKIRVLGSYYRTDVGRILWPPGNP